LLAYPLKPNDTAREGTRKLTLNEIHLDALTTAYGPLAEELINALQSGAEYYIDRFVETRIDEAEDK